MGFDLVRASAPRAWQAFTPTVTPTSGAFGALGTVTGAWTIINNQVHFTTSATITSVGTAAGAVVFTLPAKPIYDVIAFGRERAATGKGLQGEITAGTATMTVVNAADNTFPGGSGYRLQLNGSYPI